VAETKKLALVLTAAALAGCAAPLPIPPTPPPYVTKAPRSLQLLDGYKKLVARRIVQVHPYTYSEPMPEMMKSIVVLDITIDRLGRPVEVLVHRSNGYRQLEQRALESVVRAGPFAPPEPDLLEGDAVSFLETFLFRQDDFFQVRSLVGGF
jgi:periplasmic protein TonB